MNKHQILDTFIQKIYENDLSFILYLTKDEYINIQNICKTNDDILKILFKNKKFFSDNFYIISNIIFHNIDNPLELLKPSYGHYRQVNAIYVELKINSKYIDIIKTDNNLIIKILDNNINMYYFDEYKNIFIIYDDNDIFYDFISAGLNGLYISYDVNNIITYTHDAIIKDWI